jgi:hypothetical protein
MIIQIDHVVIVNICKQILIISINSVMQMNLRLVWASQFLSQFSNLKIRHKLEKHHLILDALSRLQSLNKKNLLDDHAKLNELFVDYTKVIYVYSTILMKLNSEFRAKIIEKYFKDESWKKIIQTIDQNAALRENAAELLFVREFVTISRESNFYMTSNIEETSSDNTSESISSFNNISVLVSSFNEIQERSKSMQDKQNKNLFIMSTDQQKRNVYASHLSVYQTY